MKWIPLLFRGRPRLRVSSMSTGQWQTDRKVLRNTKLEKKAQRGLRNYNYRNFFCNKNYKNTLTA